LAQKEIYRLDIKVGVSGDSESKSKLTAVEKMTQQIEKKTKALDKLTSSPSVKIKDNTSNTLNKIKSKAIELNRTGINPSVRITDNASSRISEISSKLKRLESTNASVTLRIKDQTSSYKNKVQAKNDKLKSANVNPTAKVQDQASDKIDKIKSNADKLNNKKINLMAKLKDDISNPLVAMGSKISNVTKDIAKKTMAIGLAATLAVGGIGAGTSIKTFATFEKGLSSVKAVTHATDSEMKTLKDTAINLGASTAWSAVEVTKAEELLGQAGFSVQETITALPGLLSLASAGGLDLATATDIASGTLRAFNLDASKTGHVADVLALSASATNSDVTDLGESMKYVAPVAQSLGISLEDTAAATGLLSNANIKGSQAGTILRQTMARLASPTSEAAKIMQKYGINAFDAQGNMKPLSSVVDNLNGSLGKLTSQQRADVISTIFGTESMSGVMALMNQGGQSLNDLSQKLKDTKGSADEMANTKLDNLSGQWEQLKGSVETAQIQLGEKLAPHTKEFVTWLTSKIPVISETIQKLASSAIDKLVPQLKTFGTWLISSIPAITQGISSAIDKVTSLATKFNGLNTSTKNSILTLGLLTVALGPLSGAVSMIAKLGSGIGSLVKLVSVARGATAAAGAVESIGLAAKILPALFSPIGLAIAGVAIVAGTAIIANNNLMKKSCTTTVEELGPVEKIMNKLNGNIIKSKSELIDAGLIYDDFGDGVSDAFKKAAKDASNSLLKLEMNINRLTTDDKFDDVENNQLKNWVNSMAYEGINAIKAKQSEVKSELQKTFSLDGVTSKAEQGTLDYVDKFFSAGVNKELEIRNEIYAIGDKAIKDHGKLLDEDIAQIKEKAAELEKIKLEYANADSAGEQAYAKSKFTSSAERVTGVDGASDLLKDRATEYNKSITEAKANYEKGIARTQSLLKNDDLSADDRTNLENTLNESTAARDKALDEAKTSYESDLETLYNSYPNAKGKLNEKTGEKFNSEDIKRNQTLGTMTNSKFARLTDVKESGMYSLINNDTGNFESVYAEVDKSTGEIIGAYAYCSGAIGGYTAEMADNAKKSALDISNGNFQITSTLNTVKSASVNAAGEMIGDGDRLISKLGAVQTAQDGTLYRTMQINGTAINVQVDSSGAITNLDEVCIKADEASKGRSVEITSNTAEETTKAQEYTTTMEAIPPSTDAQINSNVAEVTSQTTGLLDKLKYISSNPWTAFVNFVKGENSNSEYTYTEQDTHDENRTRLGGDGYAVGTNNATAGIHPVAENGFEIVYGRQNRLFTGGEKVLNHEQSKSFLQNQQNNEPFQVKQGQYQLAQPQQVQVATVGGNSVQVDVQVNGGNQDVEGLIVEVTQEVGKKLKEALTNIKK
jgi:TP901 family phage tail tape measure protein